MNLKTNLLIGIFLMISVPIIGQGPKQSSWNTIEKQMQENPRYFMVFLHTSWCNYCVLMQNKAFKDPEVIALLDQNFYYIDLDAQYQDTINLKGIVYRYKPRGLKAGAHELAKILNAQEIYPTVVFLDEQFNILYKQNGYISAKKLKNILGSIVSYKSK